MNYPSAKPTGNTVGRYLIAGILFLFAAGVFGWQIMNNIRFNQNVSGHLKLASDANNIELAERELTTVLNYLETNGLTSGHTSVLYKKPTEDIGFWYENLKASKTELNRAKDAEQLVQTNTLIKLRETLTDNGGEGKTKVTYPDGLARYPNNLLIGSLTWAAVFSLFGIMYYAFSEEQWKKWNAAGQPAKEDSAND